MLMSTNCRLVRGHITRIIVARIGPKHQQLHSAITGIMSGITLIYNMTGLVQKNPSKTSRTTAPNRLLHSSFIRLTTANRRPEVFCGRSGLNP